MIQRSDCDTAGWRNTNGFPVRTKNIKSESGHWHFWSMLFRNLQPHGEKSHMSFLLPNNCVRQYPFVGDAPSCSQRPMVFPASLQSGVEACPRNADKFVLACVRLWKNSAGQDKKMALRKENWSYFCTTQNRNTVCTAHRLLWLLSIPAVTSAGLYGHFHLSLQLQAEGRQHPFYLKTMLVRQDKCIFNLQVSRVLSRAILISTRSEKQLIIPDSACGLLVH